ncbi:MAG: DNA-binding transcriptional LysR family regulator [Granulosicoccus sp.]|jgi:DNA-binding transcriptional LysR family regulator
MGQLEDLRAFVQIVEQESISNAAKQAGIAKSAMSRKLSLLEERLQTALNVRTTRQWGVTEAGRQFYERGKEILSSYDEFESEIRAEDQKLTGEIRISVPLYFGKAALNDAIFTFSSMHPDVHLNIEFSDRIVDIVGENFDLVIRISELQDSSLIARRLCQTQHLFCASPCYIASNPEIRNPEDLKAHRILQFGFAKQPKWKFTSKSGKVSLVALHANLNSQDGGFLLNAAQQGHGIVRLPDFLVRESLNEGALTQLLPDFSPNRRGVYMLYPVSRYLPYRTRQLMEFLIQELRQS